MSTTSCHSKPPVHNSSHVDKLVRGLLSTGSFFQKCIQYRYNCMIFSNWSTLEEATIWQRVARVSKTYWSCFVYLEMLLWSWRSNCQNSRTELHMVLVNALKISSFKCIEPLVTCSLHNTIFSDPPGPEQEKYDISLTELKTRWPRQLLRERAHDLTQELTRWNSQRSLTGTRLWFSSTLVFLHSWTSTKVS